MLEPTDIVNVVIKNTPTTDLVKELTIRGVLRKQTYSMETGKSHRGSEWVVTQVLAPEGSYYERK